MRAGRDDSMKLLYILNYAHKLNQFSESAMLAARSLGWEFHVATNWGYESDQERDADAREHGILLHQIDFHRNPLHPSNYRAYRQLFALMQREKYDLVHCNTPIGGVAGRIAARRLGIQPVIYEAHGFHFYQGAALSSWLIFYPIERMLARWTDALITINTEDERRAEKMRLRKGGRRFYLPGIGIDVSRYADLPKDCLMLRDELKIAQSDPLVLSVGELNRNKNHEVVIRALAYLPSVHYAIAGKGELLSHLIQVAREQGVVDRVHFLGFRTDIYQVYQSGDIFCLPSFREGLSASIMEAMASGLPVVCSNIRGNIDLVLPGEGGMLITPNDVLGFSKAIQAILTDPLLAKRMGEYNRNRIQGFSLEHVTALQRQIYEAVSGTGGNA